MLDCVILAAGDGTRMGSPEPKPLIELAGIPLLQHVLERLAHVNPRRVIVITGYKHQLVERFLLEIKPDLEFELVSVVNREYLKENGYSLLQAAGLLTDRFLLTMADHIVDPEIYSLAAAHEGLGLCVDSAPALPGIVDEATKVLIEAGRIVKIGKGLSDWNGLDTGVFIMTPAIFSALRYLVDKDGDATLSTTVATLIEWGERIAAIDVSGRPWIDIDTPQDLALAARLLKIDTPLRR